MYAKNSSSFSRAALRARTTNSFLRVVKCIKKKMQQCSGFNTQQAAARVVIGLICESFSIAFS